MKIEGDSTIKGKKAIVKSIQVGGWISIDNLKDACKEYLKNLGKKKLSRDKMCFVVETEKGQRQITIRQEEGEMVAYGDFSELPSFVEYAFLLREQGKI